MTKVHPGASLNNNSTLITNSSYCSTGSGILTVWKKSLLFNSDGFTVFDGKGNLLFRVDDYGSGDIVLMDASGKSIFTIRRKRLSLIENWMVYEGEKTTNPILSMKKQVNFFMGKSTRSCLAQVSLVGKGDEQLVFEIEGSYAKRCCVVYDDKRRPVAEICRKEAAVGGVNMGLDVFRLVIDVVMMDPSVAMALVILLDQMFDSPKTLTHWLR
ncbi:protein LURP-one-related 8-like [Impatiens glandulifera]|uniref:protein LURP-one-related 8-like n=1 Tax=Impatiens glandulifera TaxID=253017 RepID=UPI001FB14434|nr:protein LURP-one-related 8-like [Impatiens glandulifera]